MAFVEQLATLVNANRGKVFLYGRILQLFAGLVFLGLGYFMGNAHFHLIREGLRALGRIVDYKQETFWRPSSITSTTTTVFMPMVEFQTNDRFVQFPDWLGTNNAGNRNVPVIVLFDPANPSVAMIDRPVWNWTPWAPAFAVGVLLVHSAINCFFRSQRSAET